MAASSPYQRPQHHQLQHHHHQELELQHQHQEYRNIATTSSEFEERRSFAAATPSDSTSNMTKTSSASPSSDTRVQQQVGISSKSSLAQHFDVKTMQKEAVLSYVKVQAGRLTRHDLSLREWYWFCICPLYRVDKPEVQRPHQVAAHPDSRRVARAAPPMPARVVSFPRTWSRQTPAEFDRPLQQAVSRHRIRMVKGSRCRMLFGGMQRSRRLLRRTLGSSEW